MGVKDKQKRSEGKRNGTYVVIREMVGLVLVRDWDVHSQNFHTRCDILLLVFFLALIILVVLILAAAAVVVISTVNIAVMVNIILMSLLLLLQDLSFPLSTVVGPCGC
ncbi:hypothetical protein F5H01DRAFT_340865 [Linnemannia elongata]|nr:hypothetical protein F5H01DRAFT_340865 [Linnemannia elongata]